MTKDELLEFFEENGIVFQIIMDHGDGVHVHIKYDEEEEVS
jgi:hypothetical protein